MPRKSRSRDNAQLPKLDQFFFRRPAEALPNALQDTSETLDEVINQSPGNCPTMPETLSDNRTRRRPNQIASTDSDSCRLNLKKGLGAADGRFGSYIYSTGCNDPRLQMIRFRSASSHSSLSTIFGAFICPIKSIPESYSK